MLENLAQSCNTMHGNRTFPLRVRSEGTYQKGLPMDTSTSRSVAVDPIAVLLGEDKVRFTYDNFTPAMWVELIQALVLGKLRPFLGYLNGETVLEVVVSTSIYQDCQLPSDGFPAPNYHQKIGVATKVYNLGRIHTEQLFGVYDEDNVAHNYLLLRRNGQLIRVRSEKQFLRGNGKPLPRKTEVWLLGNDDLEAFILWADSQRHSSIGYAIIEALAALVADTVETTEQRQKSRRQLLSEILDCVGRIDPHIP